MTATATPSGNEKAPARNQQPQDRLSVFKIMSDFQAADPLSLAHYLAGEAYGLTPEHRAAHARLATLPLPEEARLKLDDLLVDATSDAVRIGAWIGYALAKTWPTGGFEELDGWLHRAIEYAGVDVEDSGALRRG